MPVNRGFALPSLSSNTLPFSSRFFGGMYSKPKNNEPLGSLSGCGPLVVFVLGALGNLDVGVAVPDAVDVGVEVPVEDGLERLLPSR